MENEKIAMEVLRDIAMDPGRVLVERQRAIDALTLFRESAIPVLQHIERKTDMDVLRQRSSLYLSRIREGAVVTMTL